ncbi:MBL fold metallo-hydrolase [Candidatus Uhrbacteria bacterium]|nr:MBL fold metallo-hydrolase [Candidatus Uhrbacteria bacterium]
MVIQWYGHACFRIQGNSTDVAILIDPFDASIGWKLPRLSADVVLVSTDTKEHNALETVKKGEGKEPFIIQEAGEYEVRGALIHGIPLSLSSRIFVIRVDEMTILHCGSLNRELTESELDNIGRVDILVLPIGGGNVLDAKKANEIVSEIEPRIVIPMQYRLTGLRTVHEPADPFFKALGIKPPEAQDKYKILKKDLPAGEMQLVVLQPA